MAKDPQDARYDAISKLHDKFIADIGVEDLQNFFDRYAVYTSTLPRIAAQEAEHKANEEKLLCDQIAMILHLRGKNALSKWKPRQTYNDSATMIQHLREQFNLSKASIASAAWAKRRQLLRRPRQDPVQFATSFANFCNEELGGLPFPVNGDDINGVLFRSYINELFHVLNLGRTSAEGIAELNSGRLKSWSDVIHFITTKGVVVSFEEDRHPQAARAAASATVSRRYQPPRQAKNKVTCFRCAEAGHTIRDCPHKDEAGAASGNAGGAGGSGGR